MWKYFVFTLFVTYLSSSLLSFYFSISIQTPDDEYDFIIVGGGTTGLVVANRLSEIPNIKILVLEAGEEDYPNALVSMPAMAAFSFLSSVNWGYKTVPQKHSCKAMQDQQSYWPRGKVLGGTSSINFMIYARGNKDDFDQWERNGADGWGYNSVLPYFKKSENFTGSSETVDKNFHGKNGPLKTNYIKSSPLHGVLVDAMTEIGLNNNDYNGEEQIGFSHVQQTKDNGARVNSVSAFLRPIIKARRDRLHVLTRAHVKSIKFNDQREAIGVSFVRDGKESLVRTRKEVILSAGAVGSPQILMLSGIGEAEHLKDKQIKVVADLPGVGSNLQDHIMVPACIKADQVPDHWVNGHVLNPINAMKELYEYLTEGTGFFASSLGTESHGFVNSAAKNVSRLGKRPDLGIIAEANKTPASLLGAKIFQHMLNYAEQFTDHFLEWSKKNNDEDFCDFYLTSIALHPYSVGNIRLRSNHHMEHPDIDPNYLSDVRDVRTITEGFRLFENLEKTETFKKFNAKMSLYSPECGSEKDPESPRSDEFYECFIRKFTWTVYHPVGTAKIGSRDDPSSVVDPRLRVHKVSNLRVADASVMPEITSANTQAPCYMIGEKVSDMIKQDWNLHQN